MKLWWLRVMILLLMSPTTDPRCPRLISGPKCLSGHESPAFWESPWNTGSTLGHRSTEDGAVRRRGPGPNETKSTVDCPNETKSTVDCPNETKSTVDFSIKSLRNSCYFLTVSSPRQPHSPSSFCTETPGTSPSH